MDNPAKSVSKRRLTSAAVALMASGIGSIAAVAILVSLVNGLHLSHTDSLLDRVDSLINLQPEPAEQVSEAINFPENKALVVKLTSDLVSCFESAKSVDDGIMYVREHFFETVSDLF